MAIAKKKIFLETPRKLMREIPWEPFRKISLFISLMIYLGSIMSTVALGNPFFEWGWWWLWFGFFLTFLPIIMGRIACGWFCPYAALHDIIFTKLGYPRVKWPSKLANYRFPIIFGILVLIATIEIFWEWDFFIWYCRIFLILAIIWGLIFEPRDWCRYICPLGVYAQIYARIRILGVRVDSELCKKCKPCLCTEKCLMKIDWNKEIIDSELWITPDYCVGCMNCVNQCPFGAVYAWRVH